jgi:hypothetical protein
MNDSPTLTIRQIDLPQVLDPITMGFPDLTIDLDDPTTIEVLHLKSRIPQDLQTPPKQLVILGKIRFQQIRFNVGTYTPELDTHFKSVKMLLERKAIEYKERRLYLTKLGVEIIEHYIKHSQYLTIRDRANFQKEKVQKGVMAKREADVLSAFNTMTKRTDAVSYEDQERRLKALIRIFFMQPSLDNVLDYASDHSKVKNKEIAYYLETAVMSIASMIKDIIKRTHLKEVTVDYEANIRTADIQLTWHLYPSRAPIQSSMSITF